jgi:hypothetical protein
MNAAGFFAIAPWSIEPMLGARDPVTDTFCPGPQGASASPKYSSWLPSYRRWNEISDRGCVDRASA